MSEDKDGFAVPVQAQECGCPRCAAVREIVSGGIKSVDLAKVMTGDLCPGSVASEEEIVVGVRGSGFFTIRGEHAAEIKRLAMQGTRLGISMSSRVREAMVNQVEREKA
jgi:hypothetical protein